MRALKSLRIAFVFFALFSFPLSEAASVAGKAIPPSPRSYVYDETGSLSQGFKDELFQKLSAEDRLRGNQMVVALFSSLDQEDLVDYGTRVFKAWNPGGKGKDNGILILAFLKEHKIRIEVGYGLEPYITDAKSKEVILNDLAPAFKAGEFDRGVGLAIVHLLQIAHKGQGIADAGDATAANPAESAQLPNQDKQQHIPFGLILIIIFIIIQLIFRRRGGGGIIPIFFGGGGFGGGGFGGGGGGGFSGGGGSSGGGGASGDW